MAGTRCKRSAVSSTYCAQHRHRHVVTGGDEMSSRSPMLLPHTTMISKSIPPKGDPKDHYKVISEIGRGGSGVVYKAKRLSDGNIIAVKVVDLEEQSKDELLELMQEVNVWRELSSCEAGKDDCSLVPIYDCFYSGKFKQLHIEMELVEGGDGTQWLRRNRKHSNADIVRIAHALVPVLHTLQRMHDLHILHRDIKPENLLFDGEKHRLLIGDLGLGCSGDECQEDGGVVGTDTYIDPRALLMGKSIDYASDLYSLGVTIYMMLMQRPWQEKAMPRTKSDYLEQHEQHAALVNERLSTCSPHSVLYVLLQACISMTTPFDIKSRQTLHMTLSKLSNKA